MSRHESAIATLMAARSKAVAWLLQAIESDGRPLGSEQGNGWTRVPWALSLSGETAVAEAVMEWALRDGLDGRGAFREGPALGTGQWIPYKLGQLIMGALQLGRYDAAEPMLDRLQEMQLPNGGLPIEPPGSEFSDITEMTSTAQAGLAALRGGRMDMAGRCRDWVMECLDAQPEFPHRLYAGRIGDTLMTELPERFAWLLRVEFDQPRQCYFQSAIASAFLGYYAMRTGDQEALAGGHRYLLTSIEGTDEQFTDLTSVQACKFGWAVAVMAIADPTATYDTHLARMADWFLDRQESDGSWGPSKFMSPSPSMVDLVMKTAEHVMEVSELVAGLAAVRARQMR